MKRFGLVCALVGLMASSCVGEPGAPEWAGTETDSAGVHWVHNPAEGIWGEGEGWTFTETLSVGAPVDDRNYEFGRITGMAVGPHGEIYVLDQMASEIKVFDASGVFIRSMGGRGEGPGELSSGAAGVFLQAGIRLVVPDMGNQRINWLSLDGEPLFSARVTYGAGFPVRWDADGGAAIMVQRRAMGGNEDADLEAGDPLARIDEEGGDSIVVILPKAKTVWMEGNAPRFKYFETEPSWDLGPLGKLRTAMTAEYLIELRDLTGTIHTVITKDAPPRPVTDADIDRFLELFRDGLARMDLSPGAIQRQVDNVSFGANFPALNQIMEGPGGTTLVQHVSDLFEMETLDISEEMSKRLGALVWDVFDPGGRFLGEIELPYRFTPLAWTADAVYGRWLDVVDRHHLIVLSVENVRP